MRSARRLLLVAIGSLAYAGLAVLGWGGFRSFFSHPAFVALVVVLLALSVVASFAGGNLDPIRWIGVALFAAGGALRICPVFVLGERFSSLVAIQPGHTL